MVGGFFAAYPAMAAEHVYQVALDTDDDSATGCSLDLGEAGSQEGFEFLLELRVDPNWSPPRASTIGLVACASNAWDYAGADEISPGGWDAGIDTGEAGGDFIEGFVSLESLGFPESAQVVVKAIAISGAVDALVPGGGAIPIPEPAGPWVALAAIVTLMGLAARRRVRSGRAAILLLVLCVAARAGFAEPTPETFSGSAADWDGIAPVAHDAAGDSDDPAADVLALFVEVVGGDLVVRVDVSDLEGACTVEGDPACDGVCGALDFDPGDCNGICEIGDADVASADCDGVCDNADEASSFDCDGNCDLGDDPGGVDCDDVCSPGEADGSLCDDADACTIADACSGEVCSGEAVVCGEYASCNEGNCVCDLGFVDVEGACEPESLTVTAISPDFGARYGGTTVTVSGTGFQPDTTLRFDDLSVTSVRFIDAHTLEAVVPSGSALGSVDVVAGLPGLSWRSAANDESSSQRLADGFTYTVVSPEPEPYRGASRGEGRNDNPTGGLLLHSGEFVLARADLSVSGRGLDFVFTRTYRSGADGDGPLGHGWDANLFRRLEVLPNGNVLCFDGTGRVDEYIRLSPTDFDSPVGYYTRLVQDEEAAFTLRDRYGHKDFYDAAGRLVSEEDRRGNRMAFSYDVEGRLVQVEDTLGRLYSLSYDGNGRLGSLSDFDGRSVIYTYDDAGNLFEARSPLVTGTPHGNDFPSGKRERYGYDTALVDVRLAHNLVSVIAPNEVEDGSLTPRVSNTYGATGDEFDRVVAQLVGGTNASGVVAGGTLALAYDFAPGDGPEGAVAKTELTDRRGNRADYFHDAAGHCLQYIDDPGGVTPFRWSYTHNVDGELTRIVLPQGNEVLSVYDSANIDRFQQGNLLSIARLPDAGRGGESSQLVMSYSYEPLFNQVLSETGPRGNDESYVPQNGGAHSKARYTTTYTYDWQEDATPPAEAVEFGISIPGELLGRGDANDNGRLDFAMGNRVRRDDPSVTLLAGSNQATLEGDTHQEIVWRYSFDAFGQLIQSEDPRGNVDNWTYFPENDPDGDGLDLVAGRDVATGGYLQQVVEDAIAGPRRQDSGTPVALAQGFTRDPRGNVLTVTDGRGLIYTSTYNALNQVVQSESPKVHASQATGYLQQFTYDANDNRLEEATQNWTMSAGVPSPVAAPLDWFRDSTVYDLLDNPIARTQDARRDPEIPASVQLEQLTTEFRYDANENPVRVESPLATAGSDFSNVVGYSYDARDLEISETRGVGWPGASTTTQAYDLNGNPTIWTDAEDNDMTPGGETRVTVYDGFDRAVTVIDRAGNEQRSTLDPDGAVVHEESWGPVDGAGGDPVRLAASDQFFDELGRLFQVDQELFLPVGASTLHTLTLSDGPLTPGDGQLSQRYEIDANGRRTFRVEDDGAVYRFEYDGADRMTRSTIPLVDPSSNQSQTSFYYDGNGNVIKAVEIHVSPEGLRPPATLVTLFVIDAVNRVARVSDTLGQTTYTDHDSRGNVLTEYDARAAPLTDPLGLFPDAESPEGVPAEINARGNPVRFFYDGASRLWLTRKELHVEGQGDQPLDTSNAMIPSGRIDLATEHDANDRVVSRIDGNGHATTTTYDPLNRPVLQTNADGGTLSASYDLDHQVVGTVDENGTVHSLSRDGLGRLTAHAIATDSSQFVPGTALPMLVGTTLQSFEYDGLSRRTKSTDNNDPVDPEDDWTVTTVWDSISREVEQDQLGHAVGRSYASDDWSELHYPGAGRVVTFGYDAHDQLTTVSNPTRMEVVTSFLGDCCPSWLRRVQSTTDTPSPQDIVTTQHELDLLNRIVNSNSVVHGVPDATVGQQFPQYSRDNQLTDQNLVYATDPSNVMSIEFNWQLNSLNQLVAQDRTQDVNGSAQTDQRDIAFGPGQEILQASNGVDPPESRDYDETYQRTDAPYQYNSGPGTGIRTVDADHVYQWDGLNRLRAVRRVSELDTVIARYLYDADAAIASGRRVAKIVNDSGSLDGLTLFYYDGDQVIEERTLEGESERVTRQFFYGYRRPDDLVAMDVDTNDDGDPDDLFFYASDVNNNVTHLSDSSGGLAEIYSYDLFENPTVHDPATFGELPESQAGNPYYFTGRRFESETGLYYYRARYYDPESGEFLSRDPIGMWGDPANDGNGMAYVGNNPWNWVDPSGNKLKAVWGSIGGTKGYRIYDDGLFTKTFLGNYYKGESQYYFKGKKQGSLYKLIEKHGNKIEWDGGPLGDDWKGGWQEAQDAGQEFAHGKGPTSVEEARKLMRLSGKNGEQLMDLCATARGSAPTLEQQKRAKAEIKSYLGFDPSDQTLQEMDHYYQTYHWGEITGPGRYPMILISTAFSSYYNSAKAFDQYTGLDLYGWFLAEQGSFNRPGVSPPRLRSVHVAIEGAWDSAVGK